MSPSWIEIDDEVMAKIEAEAEPFLGTPNDALRQLLGLDSASESCCAPRPRREPRDAERSSVPRVVRGEGLPMSEYELPLLRTLERMGGSGPRWRVIEEVGSMLADRLSEVDHGRVRNGEERWENRAAFARLRAVEQGYVHSGSKRGVWELSDAGVERLRRLEADVHGQAR